MALFESATLAKFALHPHEDVGCRGRQVSADLEIHLINYLGSCGGGQALPRSTMIKLMDRTIHSLQRKLAAENDEALALTMHFPTAWDPYFRDTMSVFDAYHYGTQHVEHHRKQLTLPDPSA